MFLGLRTVIYHAPDLPAAKTWYANAFGVTPYFDEPFYVGFDIGGFELGLDPDTSGVNVGNNAVAYWGVADIDQAYRRLLERGAEARAPVKDVGGDIKVATVADPFGNVIGLIQNPHFSVKDSPVKGSALDIPAESPRLVSPVSFCANRAPSPLGGAPTGTKFSLEAK